MPGFSTGTPGGSGCGLKPRMTPGLVMGDVATLPGGSGCGLKAWAVPILIPSPASAMLPDSSAPMTIFFMVFSLFESPGVPVGLQHQSSALEDSWRAPCCSVAFCGDGGAAAFGGCDVFVHRY